MKIEFRPIADFPGYRVGDDGSIWSRRDFRGGLRRHWRKLRPRADKDGYLSVTLNRNGIRKTRKVTHIVLETFVGPRPDGAESCHFPDPSPLNNRVGNLRWASHRSNISDKVAMGRQARGETHGRVKLTERKVARLRVIRTETGMSFAKLGFLFGISHHQAFLIVHRRNWKHTA